MNQSPEAMATAEKSVRCSRCILPGNFPRLAVDENGVCRVCREYDEKWSVWKKAEVKPDGQQLEMIFKTAKKAKGKYDCLVPISGGKDSLYVLFLCKKRWGMNPLAVNFNNGFQTADAARNITQAVQTLNVDYLSFKPNWNLMRALYKSFLLNAGEFCTPCNLGIRATIRFVARKERIPLCLTGDSPRSDEGSPREIYACTVAYFNKVISSHQMTDTIKNSIYEKMEDEVAAANSWRARIARQLYDRGFVQFTRKPRKISLPQYVEWNEDEIYKVLTKELGWRISSEDTEHTDCLMNPVKGYLRYLRWGFGSKTQKAAALIRDGQMSRAQGLAAAAGEDKEPPELEELLHLLGLERGDMETIRKNYHLNFMA